MKTLYISDLDGTLMNSKKRITPFTAQAVNACIARGAGFAVATARMPYGCDYRLEELHMNTPGIVTNGVFLYDFAEQKILSAEFIEQAAALRALEQFAQCGTPCFLYTLRAGKIAIFYNDPALKEQTQYYSERALQACETVEYLPQLQQAAQGGEVFYIAVTGAKEALEPLCARLDALEGVAYSFYLNIYNGLYCLEVFSAKANKRHALEKLRALTGCEELVVFGDNLNDLPMIEIADRCYAPANALDVVKERVTGVLASCDEDGVGHFLEEELNKL